MIMKKYLSFFAAALLLAACQSDDIADQQALRNLDDSIQFGVETTEEMTRTSGKTMGVIGDDATTGEIALSEFGFGVFASYTGDNVYENVTVTPDFMYNQKVTADGSNWVYNPLKYWPNTGYTTFFAYAPYVDHTDLDFEKPYKHHCIAGMSSPSEEGDPWLIYVLAEEPWKLNNGQCDLLFGTNDTPDPGNLYNKLWFNQKKSDISSKMKFTFRHALGIIGDEIKIKIDSKVLANLQSANAKIYIDHIDMKYKNLTRKGKLILNSQKGSPNWKPIVSGELTTEHSVTITKEEIDALNSGKYTVLDGFVDLDNQHLTSTPGLDETTDATAVVLKTGRGLFYIPYQVAPDPQQLEVTLYYQILAKDMEPYNGVAVSTINLKERPGRCQDVIINIKKDPKYDKVYAPKIGDFYYSDGTWGEKNVHETGAKPIGTICYLGDNIGTYNPETGEKGTAKHGLVMAFKNSPHTFAKYSESTKYTRWGEYGDTPLDNFGNFQSAYNDLNGEYNTNVLFNLWTVHSAMYIDNFWAAWDCAQYATEGVGAKGKWHIGTFGEWALICDALGKKFGNGSGTDIKDAIEGGSISDGTEFYPSLDGTVEGSFMENLESNNSAKFWMFDPGFEGQLGRNKLQNGLRYWTSTEASQANAISFEFKYNPLPNYSDAVMFFISTNTNKEKQYLVRPLLTF